LSGEEQTRSVGAVVQTMAQRDPARASAWVDQFPGGEARDRAMEALVKGWSQRDPEAASAWLAEQPSGTGKDLATKQFLEQASFIKPDVAWKLATAITDPWLQAVAIDKAAQMWMTKDPKTARAVIQSSSLPAAQKAALLKLYQ
jgi:hypothetical protein